MKFSVFEVAMWSVIAVVAVVFLFCFAVAFAVSMAKFGASSDKSMLEETDKWWLAIISPCHIPSDQVCKEPEADCAWTENAWYSIKMIALALAAVLMLVPSVMGLASFMTGSYICQFLMDGAKKILGKMHFSSR